MNTNTFYYIIRDANYFRWYIVSKADMRIIATVYLEDVAKRFCDILNDIE